MPKAARDCSSIPPAPNASKQHEALIGGSPRAAAGAMLTRSRDKPEKKPSNGGARRPTGRADRLHAGIVSLAVFLPGGKSRVLQAGGADPRPFDRGLSKTGEETRSGGNRVVVREADFGCVS